MVSDNDYRLNMHPETEARLVTFLQEEDFTWWGLAECLKRNSPRGDFEELVFMVNNVLSETDDE